MSILKAVHRMAVGDTAGTAASAAGKTFQESFQNVFSSKETADIFEIDEAVLKQAFEKKGGEFSTYLEGQGVKKESIEGLDAFRNEVNRIRNEGGRLSESGMQAMLRNQGELDNMYGGFSRAGATASPNAILRGLGGEGSGTENAMGIAAIAGLSGGLNVMMGGDFTEGAAVGGGVAFAGRALAKGVANSMGEIEQSMMKSILGDDMVTAGTREITEDVTSTLGKGKKIKDLTTEEMAGLKLSDVTNYRKNQIGNQSVEDYVKANPSTTISLREEIVRTTQQTKQIETTGGQARRQNLEAIKKISDDDERLQGFGKKKMRDMLNPNKEKNVAINNRALVMGGGMLSGVAFTGSADKRDYRRGFNAHRGNRI